MKINEFTTLFGPNVLLVPYEEKHVPKYHEWMKSNELLSLTASEPLSLSQEYEMQKSWRTDTDKCTFIIIDKSKLDESKDEITAMIGDINIFLINSETNENTAEIEIMIAEPWARGCGRGSEAVLLMLRYGIEALDIAKFQAKISIDNEPSLKLFTKLEFNKVDESVVFKEITLEKKVTEKWMKWLLLKTNYYKVVIKTINKS